MHSYLMVFAILFSLCIAVFFLIQAWMSWRMIRVISKRGRTLLVDDECPPAAVILCLRGSDPFIGECIQRAATQDYPQYQLRIIVDHDSDPVMQVVQDTIQSLGKSSHIQVESLQTPLATCSLKCSSLAQAEAGLDTDVEVVALLDADTLPHATWLRELVAPLTEPGNGAATGQRWYMPEAASIGAMVRYFWNCAAVIQMHSFDIAWGGSVAIRRDVIRDLQLPNRWRKAFCEDTMLLAALRERDLKLQFVPTLMMVNRESCDVTGFFGWVRRQLLTARLYHPRWPLVVCHGVLVTAMPICAAAIIGLSAATASWLPALIAGVATVGYGAGLAGILLSTEIVVRKTVAARGECTQWLTARACVNFFLAIPVIQLLYPVALFSSLFVRQVKWRGITYRIKTPWEIELLEYRPYESAATPDNFSL